MSVPAARAEQLVAIAQLRFLEKGFYLFRAEQHFGIGGRGDRVALFPRADRYEILRLMGTNGWNYEGRFPSAIRDAGALARELVESQRLYSWWD